MLIGDYELSDMQDTKGVTFLFVIFTTIGVVILLNVLIAVVSDSYERATLNSSKLFGRARALFVAQNEALEGFLKPGNKMTNFFRSDRAPVLSQTAFAFFRWIVLVAIIGTACDTTLFLMWFSVENLIDLNDKSSVKVIPACLSKSNFAVNLYRNHHLLSCLTLSFMLPSSFNILNAGFLVGYIDEFCAGTRGEPRAPGIRHGVL